MRDFIANFKKNWPVLILASIVYTLIMTISLSLNYLIGIFGFFIIIFIVCPFVFSFSSISNKTVQNQILDYKDIYLGYKDLRSSIFYVLKKTLIPLLISFLSFFIAYFALIYFDLIFFEQELLSTIVELVKNGAGNEDVVNYLIGNDAFYNRVFFLAFLALAFGIMIFNVFGNKKIMTYIFYLNVRNPRINYEYIINKKRKGNSFKLFLFNVGVSLFYIIGLGVSFYISINYTNSLLMNLLSNLIFFAISSIALPIKYLVYADVFNKNFSNEVNILLNEKNENQEKY